MLKIVIIFFVRCYQKITPDRYRGRCRFEPTCSEYMILSVKKFGAIKGVSKGRDRIARCVYPNGGDDLP
ncbi:MAG: membrane protein insertion efficiency factor YidD [Burkholderiales bacterium]|jgi:putative membrane protein insertion efficiency factor|nr:membrane protein insertion efficiency factor YidD [Burkholderiales bacterium]